MMQDIQKSEGYLPQKALEIIAKEVQVPLSRLYALATFYKAFSLTPRGRHIIHVCTGTACHVRGADKIMDKLKRDLNVEEGGTTEDGRFTLEGVRCVGCCGLGPVIVVGENFHGKLTQKDLGNILDQYK
ncbi:MAG: NADH-quinone oxidoreductase subunit NuoE [Spirochaetes bacterium]|nr:NADH-quinone oxidoreductase subunit NuoE [Spirochaetota bacterium]